MALTTNDLALILNANTWSTAYLNRWPKRVVATAVVNQGVFTYPLSAITVITPSSGWITDTQPGMMFEITDTSGNHCMTGVLRKASTTTILYPDAKFSGDPGRTQDISIPLANNYLVYVYDYTPLWTIYSVIRDGIFYKAWDQIYVNEGDYPAPVCNIGSWRQEFVSIDTSKATLAFSALNSFDWRGLSLSYSWTLPASGATLTGGALNTIDIEVEFDPGFYLIECEISNGTSSRRAVRPVWINEASGANAPYSELGAIEIQSDQQDMQGRQMSFTLQGNRAESDFMDGGAVMLSEYPLFGGTELTAGAGFLDSYVGFVSETTTIGQRHKNQLSIETMSPFKYMENVSCSAQAVYESATPSNWSEVFTGLATPSFCAWYVIHYHCPNALLLFDFNRLPDTVPVRKTRWNITNSDHVMGLVSEVVKTVAGNFGSASDGNFHFLRNPMAEAGPFRSASMAERITLDEDYIVGDIRRMKKYRPTVGEYTAYAFRMDGVTVEGLKSVAGLKSQGQGVTKTQGAALLVDTQATLNEMCGNLMAMENNPEQFRFVLNRNMDLFDPASGGNEWITLNVSSLYDPRGNGFSGRTVARAVEREWRRAKSGYNKHISLTIQPETSGEKGETIVIPTFDSTNDTGITWGFDTLGSDYTLDFQLTDGDLEWRPSGGSGWTSVGDITGDEGDPGECPDCGTAESPDPVPVDDRPAGQDWKCVSSANIIDYVEEFEDGLVAAIDGSSSPFNFQQILGTVITVIIPTSAATTAYLTGVSDAWYGGNSADILVAFSTAFYSDLKEMVYCYLNSDGQISDLSGLLADMAAEEGIAWDLTSDLFTFLGSGGLNTAAQIMGIAAATCTGDCADWVHEWDWSTLMTEDGWTGNMGTFVPGVGWEHGTGTNPISKLRGVELQYDPVAPASTITKYSVQYEYTKGNFSTSSRQSAILAMDGDAGLTQEQWFGVNEASGTYTAWKGFTNTDTNVDLLSFGIWSDHIFKSAPYSPDGSVTVIRILVYGQGTDPF